MTTTNKKYLLAALALFAYCYKCQSLTSLLPSYVICLQLTVISEFDNVTLLPSYFKVFNNSVNRVVSFLIIFQTSQLWISDQPHLPLLRLRQRTLRALLLPVCWGLLCANLWDSCQSMSHLLGRLSSCRHHLMQLAEKEGILVSIAHDPHL